MKLLPRVAVTLTAVVLPATIILGVAQLDLRDDLVVALIVDTLEMHASGLDRAQCEADPTAWSEATSAGDNVLYAFDEEFRPTSAGAPPADALIAELRAGAPVASRFDRGVVGGWFWAMRKTAWGTGRCAYMLGARPVPPKGHTAALRWQPFILPIIAPLAGILAVLMAIVPIVRRVRKLSSDVAASVKTRYGAPVNSTGSDEIADLARAFNDAAHELRTHLDAQEKREDALREYLANTTHDLRAPLSVLLGQLAELRARLPEDDPAVRSAVESAHHIASLSRNLGAAARLDHAPELDKARVDLGGTVERVVARHAPLARARRVELNHGAPDAPVVVDADATLVEQAIGNVLENALSYTEAGGHVAIVVKRNANGFVVEVADDGPGIAPEERPTLLKRGARGVVGRAKASHGQGLGLAIAHEVAARHGWTMELDTSDAAGLLVRFAGASPAAAVTR